MRADAYQRFEPASGCIVGPAESSIINCGLLATSNAKKKSGPRPTQAVPSCKSFASKVVVIASCNLGPAVLVSSTSCVAFILSAVEWPEAIEKVYRLETAKKN